MHIRTHELGNLYTRLPKEGEFKAGHFASNSDEARRIGKMLTELEKQGLIISHKKDSHGSKYYTHTEEVTRGAYNMNLLRYLEQEQRLRAKQISELNLNKIVKREKLFDKTID